MKYFLYTTMLITAILAVGQLPGWPVEIPVPEGAFLSSPLLVDLDCNDVLEVVIAGPDDSLRVFSLDGTSFPGYPVVLSGAVSTPVALGPVTGTWFQLVTITDEGVVHVLEANGAEISAYPVALGYSPGPAGVALWDFTGDGRAEIVAHVGESLHLLDADGHDIPGFPVTVESEFGPAGAPAIGDITGDGRAEIVAIGYNKLYAFDYTGEVLSGFPISLGDTAGFSYSAPILADITGNDTLEIICGYHAFVGTNRGYISAWNAYAEKLSSWPIAAGGYGSWVYGSSAVGDIDGDGLPEVIATSRNGRGYVINANATAPSPWSMALGIGALESSPLVCDFDGDGRPDILFLGNDSLGTVAAFNAIGSAIDSFPWQAGAPWKLATPAIADMNGDNTLEICAIGSDGKVHLFDYPGTGTRYSRPWVMARHDPLRTGWLHPKAPSAVEAQREGELVRVSWGARDVWDLLEYRLYATSDSVNSSGAVFLGSFIDTMTIVDYDSLFSYYFVTSTTRFTESERSIIAPIDTTSSIVEAEKPRQMELSVYPNPFNATCRIATDEPVEVYDMSGRLVAELPANGGAPVLWNAEDSGGRPLPSGVYLARTKFSESAKPIVLLR
ncbi:MAG TPA: hypothetical protein ENN07_06725 [candidate division Zixibacteria bacterium]|nr:hypothetical protein [candidate division Zixibacteria bacterium]